MKNIVSKAKEMVTSHSKVFAASVTTTALMVVPTMASFASDVSSSGFLDEASMKVITDSVSQMVVTLTLVIGICIPAGFTVMGLTVGSKFALKYVKSMIAKASSGG